MDNSDIIYYLSTILTSKSLAMFSNTNKLIHDIGTKVYFNRTLEDHVSSMLTFNEVRYYCILESRIILYDNYKDFTLIKKGFIKTFENKNIKLIFVTDHAVTITHYQLLSTSDIDYINNTFNIKINIDKISICGYDLNIDYDYTTSKFIKQYPYTHTCNINNKLYQKIIYEYTYRVWLGVKSNDYHIELINVCDFQNLYDICKKIL